MTIRKTDKIRSQQIMEAVVRLHVRGISSSSPDCILDPRSIATEEWTGSGFFISVNQEEGFILTNGHVAYNSEEIFVQSLLTSDETFRAELVGLVRSLEPDVALLRLSAGEVKRFKQIAGVSRLPELKLADSAQIVRGEPIRAIGYPLGTSEPNISGGEVTNFESGTQMSCEKIVTDAAINPGNSGGPSILQDGSVIGLNTSIAIDAANIGFITPSNIVRNLVPILLKGSVENICTLGARVQKNSARNSEYLCAPEVRGVIVSKLQKGGWAEGAGLKERDILFSIDGHSIDRYGILDKDRGGRKRNLFDVLHSSMVGKSVELNLWRNGKTLRLSAKAMGCSPGPIRSRSPLLKRNYVCFGGFILQELNADVLQALALKFGPGAVMHLHGAEIKQSSLLVVTHLCHGMPGEEFGIQAGDFLVRLNARKVAKLRDVEKVVSEFLSTKNGKAAPHLVLEMSSGRLASFRRAEVRRTWSKTKIFGEP